MADALKELQHKLFTSCEQFLEEIKCHKCNKELQSPVRIKVCGHYFCKECVDMNSKQCFVCKAFFEVKELDNFTIMEKTIKNLNRVKLKLNKGLKIDPSRKKDDRKGDENEVFDNKAGPSHMIHSTRKCTTSSNNNLPTVYSRGCQKFMYRGITYVINFTESCATKRNAKGETQVHLACKKRDVNKLLSLLTCNEDFNAKDYAGWAPLHEAIESGSEEIVSLLLERGAIADIPGESYTTPLHKAVFAGNIHFVRSLIMFGANLDATDYYGQKPKDCNLVPSFEKEMSNVMKFKKENIIHHVFVPKKIVAYIHSIDESYKNKLTQSKYKPIETKREFNIRDVDLTHLLVKQNHKASFKILLCMVAGIYIVPQEWIDDIFQGKYYLPVSKIHRIIGDEELNDGIKRAMVNKLLGRPKLFDGISFFIEGHKTQVKVDHLQITKDFLNLLIITGGGKVLHRPPAPRIMEEYMRFPYHTSEAFGLQWCSNFIIFQEDNPPELQYNMHELKHKSSCWLINCVREFSFKDELDENDDIINI